MSFQSSLLNEQNKCKKCDQQYTDILNVKYKWCEPCKIIKKNFTSWTSENENIDDFFKEMQLGINNHNGIVFEWIPYSQFNNVEYIAVDGLTRLYSATWIDGPLHYFDYGNTKKWEREPHKKIALKCLYKSQNITLNGVKAYLAEQINYDTFIIYGISQDPVTKDYIIVLQDEYCYEKFGANAFHLNYLKNSTGWTSENEKIDDFIQEINFRYGIVFEWIPYNQFSDIKEISKSGFDAIYSAIWKDGPLTYTDYHNMEWTRKSDTKVILKCNGKSQHITSEFLNEVKSYLTEDGHGISQNPDTGDYIMVLQNAKYCEKCGDRYVICKWCKPCHINSFKKYVQTSENIKFDDFIQEMRLKINHYDDIVFEWIPYNQFNHIKEISNNGSITSYLAIWKDGPLIYGYYNNKMGWKRESDNQKVILKYLHNLQNVTNELLNKVNTYSINNQDETLKIYGISQNPDTKDCVLILQNDNCEKCDEKYTVTMYKWCKPCHINSFTTSNNENIDHFIRTMQLKINVYCNMLFEWIPYNQFNNIKEVSKNNLHLAIWKDGPLKYDYFYKKNWKRKSNKKVALKYLHNSQNITNESLKEISKLYSMKDCYGISQNPDTKDYILIFKNKCCCKRCNEKYTNAKYKWCKPCHMNSLKQQVTSCNIGKIEDLIQKMRLKIECYDDIIFEWIPYNQFNEIKEIDKGGFAMVYSATWKDGPLIYDNLKKYDEKWTRGSNKVVALKQLHDSQNITNEFLNEVQKYSIKNYNTSNILKIYGISQNPITNDYIMVLEYAKGGNLNNWINNNYKNFNWKGKISTLFGLIKGLDVIHKKQMVHRDFHTGNVLFKKKKGLPCISDMGLCGEVGNIDEKKIYGVMPFVAPEVLRGESYTQAADIYSFGMIMYFVATGKQPFCEYAHDEYLVLGICNGIRPELNKLEAPKFYIDLMKKCLDPNPDNRPNTTQIVQLVRLFYDPYALLLTEKKYHHYEIEKQFREVEEYRKSRSSFFDEGNAKLDYHPQAIYTSRLLNPFTKVISYSGEVIDFTTLNKG